MNREELEEAYRPATHDDGSIIGRKTFEEVVRKKLPYFQTKPDSTFLHSFVTKAIEFTRQNPTLLRDALELAVETQGTFPKIHELKELLEKLRFRKKPIDHIANTPDSRLEGCVECGFGGLVRMKHRKDDHELFGYCHCSMGRNLRERGTRGMLTVNELKLKGYEKWRR